MSFTTRKISLEHASSQREKSSFNYVYGVVRGLSSKSKATTPSVVRAFLPAIKSPLQARNRLIPQQSIKNNNSRPKRSFDEQILSHRAHVPRTISKTQRGGMSQQAHQQRRESHLNTYYNIRKAKLVEITKVNRRIYQRINSQTSLYSNTELQRSYQSNKSLSRRLSLSSASKKSSLSAQSKKQNKKKIIPLVLPIQIQPENIDTVETDKVNRYLSIFCNHLSNQPPKQKCKQYFKPVQIQNKDKENIQIIKRGGRLDNIDEYAVKSRKKSKLESIF